MKISAIRFPVVIIVFFFIYSCSKPEKFSDIPKIAFKEFLQYRNASAKDTAVDFVTLFRMEMVIWVIRITNS